VSNSASNKKGVEEETKGLSPLFDSLLTKLVENFFLK
jgi:hypothetical protein